MSVRNFYERIGESYDDVLSRFGSEMLTEKLVSAYAKDGTFASLEKAVETGDVKAAFLYAHTLKGVAANLGFSKLAKTASEMTEILRKGSFDGIPTLFEDAKRLQNNIISNV